MSGSASSWWEAGREGCKLAVGLVAVRLTGAGPAEAGEEEDAEAQRLRHVRFTAGVEYLARSYDAARPLPWRGDEVLLVVRGRGGPTSAAAHAFRLAQDLWERMHFDLRLPAGIAVHAAVLPWPADLRELSHPAVDHCRLLAEVAPREFAWHSADSAPPKPGR